MKKSGFKNKLSYQQNIIQNNDENQGKKKRKRNVIRHNPPYSMNVKTNIGKVFFKLLHMHFPKTHKFYKIFNKNTVKLSYSRMRNMACITASYNKTILRLNIQDYGYNYRKMSECPMQSKCLTPNIINEATVTSNTDIVEKIYFGLCETSFKNRYRNHTRSFRLQSYSKDTELSKYVWELKKENKMPFIKCRILRKVSAKTRFNYCKLYLMELEFESEIKSEFVSKCRKQNKLLIKSLSLKDSMD